MCRLVETRFNAEGRTDHHYEQTSLDAITKTTTFRLSLRKLKVYLPSWQAHSQHSQASTAQAPNAQA